MNQEQDHAQRRAEAMAEFSDAELLAELHRRLPPAEVRRVLAEAAERERQTKSYPPPRRLVRVIH